MVIFNNYTGERVQVYWWRRKQAGAEVTAGRRFWRQ